jgi:hypothetical protein
LIIVTKADNDKAQLDVIFKSKTYYYILFSFCKVLLAYLASKFPESVYIKKCLDQKVDLDTRKCII